MKEIKLSHVGVLSLASALAGKINQFKDEAGYAGTLQVYAVPRGGISAAYALRQFCNFELADNPATADIIVDDMIDSGSTFDRYAREYPNTPFFALIDKRTDPEYAGSWVVFPWEVTEHGGDESGTDAVTRLLQVVGEAPTREGLVETPARVIKAWKHWCSGYHVDIAALLKVFEDGAQNYDQMVIVKDIPIYSKCEHHLADIFGTATIAYIPNGKIVGLSKLSRLADAFARRLQVQERLTAQIAQALNEHLQPLGVGVVIKARHMCMESRGICQQGHHTITSALHGLLRDDPTARAEFLQLAM